MEITTEQLEAVNPYIFIRNRNIKNERGLPLSFRDRPFMVDILEDMSPLQVILKAPQVGATILQTIKAFWVAWFLGKDIIYTLPTVSDVIDIVGDKTNRIIAQNPILMDWIKEHDTVEQKSVGKNMIHFRGTFTTKQAMMVSSQLNIHDEVDASNQEVLTQYETRQQAEMGGWRWYFSHPSIVGFGIDQYWAKSDQKEWFVLCSYCNQWQFMEWPLSVNQEKTCYQCKFCGANISDDQRRKGEWRRRYPQAEYSGYHISQLICPWIPAAKIIKDFKEKEAQYFHNFTLALPYADVQSKVTLETIKNLLTPYRIPKGRIIIGLDTGIKLRYVIGDMNGLFEMGECDSYDDLQRICDKHKDWIMVSDAGGDIIGVRKFAQENSGKVFLCFFQQDKKSMDLIKWGKDREYGMVKADRNRLIQLVVDEMNDKRHLLYGDLDKWWNLWLHWSHLFREVGEDRVGNLMYVWRRNDRDDWAIAQCYWRVGMERFREGNTSFEGKYDEGFSGISEAPEVIDGHTLSPKIILPDAPRHSDDWRFY